MAILVFLFVCPSGSSNSVHINNGTWGHIGNAKTAEVFEILTFLEAN